MAVSLPRKLRRRLAALVAAVEPRQGPRRPRVLLVAARALLRRLRAVELPRAALRPVELLPVVELLRVQRPAPLAGRSVWRPASRSALRKKQDRRPLGPPETLVTRQQVKGARADGNRRHNEP